MKKHADLDIVDLLEAEVREPEEQVGPPQRVLCDVVAVALDGQVVKATHAGQRVELLQAVDVGRVEHQRLEGRWRMC